MVKKSTQQKQWKKTKSVRFAQEDIDLIDKGAEVKGLSFSEFIMYCVRKEFVGNCSISPDDTSELNNKVKSMLELSNEIKSIADSINNKTDYQLDDKLQSIIDEKEEKEFQESFKEWFTASLSSIERSSNPIQLSKTLIEIGKEEYFMNDYGVSVLEHTADSSIPIRYE